MATRKRPRPRRRRAAARTARPVRSAAARAVERVLGSPGTFALLIRRLEADGWRVEREVRAGRLRPEPTAAAAPSARDR